MKKRSATAIRFWLMTRIWYKRYLTNLLYENPDDADDFLDGKMGVTTISGAFMYSDTPEGVNYWGKKEEQFLRWYYHQKKEIFRCKWFTIQI